MTWPNERPVIVDGVGGFSIEKENVEREKKNRERVKGRKNKM